MFMPTDQSFQHHHYQMPTIPMGITTATPAAAASGSDCWSLSSSACCKDPQSAPNCPRCASTNTKFCYYNNYSLAQPRYFCKSCKRYWTKGGSLRNVPIGQGCRKSRRRSRSSAKNTSPPGQDSSSESSDAAQNNSNSVVEIDVAAVFAQYLNKDTNPGSPMPNPLTLTASSSSPSLSSSISMPSSSSFVLSETADDQAADHHLLLQVDDFLKQEQHQQKGNEDHDVLDQFWDVGITLAEDTTTTALWSSSSPQPPQDDDHVLFMSTDFAANWPVVEAQDLGELPHLMSTVSPDDNMNALLSGDDTTNWTNTCFDLDIFLK